MVMPWSWHCHTILGKIISWSYHDTIIDTSWSCHTYWFTASGYFTLTNGFVAWYFFTRLRLFLFCAGFVLIWYFFTVLLFFVLFIHAFLFLFFQRITTIYFFSALFPFLLFEPVMCAKCLSIVHALFLNWNCRIKQQLVQHKTWQMQCKKRQW